MSRIRSDSAWAGLTAEQNALLEEWLFELNLSYEETLERAKNQFGITASRTSLWRYSQAISRGRLSADLDETQATASVADSQKLDLKTLRNGAVKLIGKRLLDSTLKPGDVKELSKLANILMTNEQQEIQRAWLELSREKYRFKASKAAIQAVPLLNDYAQEEEQRELARIEMIKRKLFGDMVDYIEEPGRVPNAVWGKDISQAMDSFD